jgi:hypothetical protein
VFAIGQTEVEGEPLAFHRISVVSVAGAGNFAYMWQKMEGAQTLSGKTVVLSFYAKADTNRNMSASLEQNFGTGGSPSSTVAIAPQVFALTASWQKFELIFDIPSVFGKTLGSNPDNNLQLEFWFDVGSNLAARGGSIGQQSGTFDIAQIQLEEGTIATPFEQRFSVIEEQLCFRFYQRNPGSRGQTFPYSADYSRIVAVGTTVDFHVPLYPAMRVNPSCAGRHQINDGAVVTTSQSIMAVGSLTFPVSGLSASNYLDLLDWYADAELY